MLFPRGAMGWSVNVAFYASYGFSPVCNTYKGYTRNKEAPASDDGVYSKIHVALIFKPKSLATGRAHFMLI